MIKARYLLSLLVACYRKERRSTLLVLLLSSICAACSLYDLKPVRGMLIVILCSSEHTTYKLSSRFLRLIRYFSMCRGL